MKAELRQGQHQQATPTLTMNLDLHHGALVPLQVGSLTDVEPSISWTSRHHGQLTTVAPPLRPT